MRFWKRIMCLLMAFLCIVTCVPINAVLAVEEYTESGMAASSSSPTYASYNGVDFMNANISAQRKAALTKAMQMTYIKWTCPADFPTWVSSEGEYNTVVSTDGTSSQNYIKGKTYIGIPYCMLVNHNNNDDIAWYNALVSGKITTDYMTGYRSGKKTTGNGIDCSGFVYQALKAANAGKIEREGTEGMLTSSYYTKISWDQLLPGDLFLKNSHVMMFVGMAGSKYAVFESTAGGSKCAYNIYTKSQLLSYSCYRYKNFESSDGSVTPPTPTSASISINKTEFNIAEEFVLTLSADVPCNYYISIYDVDSGEHILSEQVNSIYKNSFNRAGHYTAYMSAYTEAGSVDSNWVDFYVYGTPPTTASFSVDKSEIALGEKVNFSTSTDAYYVRIYTSMYVYNESKNGELVYSGWIPYSFEYVPSEPGVYSAYVTACTHQGGVDSNWVSLHVGKYNVSYDAKGGSGTPSAQTKYYGKDMSLSSVVPQKNGCIFLGWSTTDNSQEVEYKPGDIFKNNADTILYAVWKCSHDFGEWIASKAPTCTEKGTERRDCKNCDHFETREVAATGHNYKGVVTDATCTEQGYTTHTCANCKDSYVDSKKEALGHNWDGGVVTKEPTEDATGIRTFTCTRCGTTRTETIAKLDHVHNYSHKVTAPTCTEQGYTTHTCAKCRDSYKDTYVEAKGHSYGSWTVTKAATCTAKGAEQRKCSNCAHTETRDVAAIGHNYKAVVTNATCTEQGYTTHTCTNCKDSYTDTYVDALGHKWDSGKVTKEPTEKETGIRTYTCTACKQTREETIPVLDHVHAFKEAVTAPTCAEDGYTTYTCACGYHYQDDFKTAFGHNYERGVCIICGEKDPNYVPETFSFVGVNMTLGNALDMNFFVNQSDIEGTGNYAVITKHYADERGDKTVKIPQSQWMTMGQMYYFTFSGVSAKEMADEFDVVIYSAEGVAISEVYTDSIQNYSRRMLDKETTKAKDKSLYVEMLNYGAAAQAKFGYDTGRPANSVVTAEEQATYGIAKREYANQRKTAKGYIGTSLTLESRILFNVVFDASYVTEGSYAVATFVNHNGKTVEDRVDILEPLGKYMYASFTKMSVADRSQLLTITLYDADGNTVVTVQDTVEGYVARMTNSDPLYEAIMKFADAAYLYFHN